MRKILVMGLPGAGKTTLAKLVAKRLNAVHFNADEIRENINRDLGFSDEDRLEQARRMGWLCDRVIATGGFAVADFICPTPQTRNAFFAEQGGFQVFCDRVKTSRFADTNRLFVEPIGYDVRVTADGTPEYWAELICRRVRPIFDPLAPTALFVGRYQPFHDGHKALVVEGIRRYGQACVAVREMPNRDGKNPFDFQYIQSRIVHALREYEGRFVVLQVPNIASVMYGRDVGYRVECVELDASLQAISATDERAKQNGRGDGLPAV